MCLQKVCRMEVMRLLDDKANPHNRMRKNRLCGFVFDLCEQNICCSFSGYCGFEKTAITAITADRNGRIGDSGNSRTSDSGSTGCRFAETIFSLILSGIGAQ